MAAGDTDQSLQLRVAERFTYCVNFCTLRCLYQLLFTLNALNVRLVGYITMYVYHRYYRWNNHDWFILTYAQIKLLTM